ncbi:MULTISPECIES: hypothetical protein [unclassified Aurantimonas]|uniref:hypothetical protein n=1 Tax=unclassified Aurantimonas TaxID=2638230 RepID=UPI002E18E249|nr:MULTISPECIES: hypothetical protein [unclassified Aurantimonas]MEC5289364.1 hypothetical protein [Aurantimonas sp. C2-3-R2]MEC5410444.1 hypothetical protein [Aurantimonas sp. C2-4-R8]
MADYSPAFAVNGERRLATPTERDLGFGCGPADLALFNGLFNQIQAELAAVHAQAGIIPNDSTSSTTVDAILALISAATGGNPAGYVLMTQARARLPIFPEVLNVDGRIVVTSPSTGTVRIPGGVEIVHRGIFTITTAQTDFATTASKIYHLRWNPTDGFALIETGDITYNPTALAETNVAFDSTYDNMIVARVVTNSSNVVTITNLSNKAKLETSGEFFLSADDAGHQGEVPVSTLTTAGKLSGVNFARTPRTALKSHTGFDSQQQSATANRSINWGVVTVSRYQVKGFYTVTGNTLLGLYLGWEAWA